LNIVPKLIIILILASLPSSMIQGASAQIPTSGEYIVIGECGLEVINYEIAYGALKSIEANALTMTVSVQLDTSRQNESEGILVLKIPRQVISADDEFAVIIGDVPANYRDYREVNSTETYRTIAIDFPSQTESIEIVGDRIPEEYPHACPAKSEICSQAPVPNAPEYPEGFGSTYQPPWHRNQLPFVLSLDTTRLNNQSIFLALTLSEIKTDRPICAASYAIEITEAASAKRVLTEVFHADNSSLMLKIDQVEGNGTRILAAHPEPILNAWVADNAHEPIIIRTSEITPEKTYGIKVSVLGAYNIRDLTPPNKIPTVEFSWEPAGHNEVTEVAIVPEFSQFLILIILAIAICISIAYGTYRQ